MFKNKKMDTKGMWKRTFSVFRGVSVPWFLYLLEIILGICSTKVALLYVPYQTKVKMGQFENGSAVWLYIGYALLAVVVGVINSVITFYAQEIVSRNMKNRMISHSLRMPLREIEKDPGRIISWINNDCATVEGLITTFVGFFTGIVSAILAMQSLGEIDKAFVAVVPVVVVYIIFCAWLEGKLFFLRQRRGIRAESELTAYMAEHLSLFTQIKQMNTEKQEMTLGKKAIETFYRADIYQALLTFVDDLFSGSITTVITILVYLIGIPLVKNQGLTIAELSIFEGIIQVAYSSLSSVPQLYTSLMYYNGQLFYIASHLSKEEEVKQRKMDMPKGDNICFKNVTFSYEEDVPVIKDASFEIEKGKVTAVVGSNGSGKSTLFKLIERFYKPDAGEITFGSYQAKDIHLDAWRRSFSYVLQEPRLFNASIRDNIAYGAKGEVSDAEIKRVADLSCCSDFVEKLPGGYDYEIGDNGSKLSGGQRQRIAIARALLADPEYLLMDEATCNLDADNERCVLNGIVEFMRGRTVIMITHDMKMLSMADNILVLDKGKVESCGDRESVLKTSKTLQQFVEAYG